MSLLWLLLPVAAMSGWWFGQRSQSHSAHGNPPPLEAPYFRGINYLLNEQPDQAVDAFIELLEVGEETAETHLALGGLYRRRGEVDRAIRIHQNLIAQPDASAEHKNEAMLELAQDYQSAGLLDRAEALFRELADSGVHQVQALRQLVDIYEQERDWLKAVGTAEELQSVTGNQLGGVIAHYYCELAESQQRGGDAVGALANLEAALKAHSASVRASLLEGDLYTAAEDHHRALAAYRRIEHQDLAYVQEALPRINACFEVLEDPEAAVAFLCELAEKDADPAVALALSQIRPSNGDYAAGREFLKGQLRKRPSLRGLHRLLELELEAGNALGQRDLNLLKSLIEELLADRHSYRCRHCGFPARSLHWQCPSCKHWNTVQPVAADLGSS